MTKEEFTSEVYSKLGNENESLLKDFIDYWTEQPIGSTKMRFEFEKKFYLVRRFATWKRLSTKYNGSNSIERMISVHEQALKEMGL